MSKFAFAPIAVFAYRRVRHLSLALDLLSACPEFADSPVFVFSDGPKAGAEEDVERVRAMLRARRTPNMTIIEAAENWGLAASIAASASQLCDDFGRVIVIEDDLLVSPAVLTWFNSALESTRNDPPHPANFRPSVRRARFSRARGGPVSAPHDIVGLGDMEAGLGPL